MPPYWPGKPHKPADRSTINMAAYRLYLRFGLRSRFWGRFWSEREVFRVLRVFSRQQVHGFIANPGGGDPIWSIDAPSDVQENRYPINTCLLRGWIEVLDISRHTYEDFPIAQPFGSFDDFSKPPYYRVTAAGWNYTISRIALAVSLCGFALSATVAIDNWRMKEHDRKATVAAFAPAPAVAPHPRRDEPKEKR